MDFNQTYADKYTKNVNSGHPEPPMRQPENMYGANSKYQIKETILKNVSGPEDKNNPKSSLNEESNSQQEKYLNNTNQGSFDSSNESQLKGGVNKIQKKEGVSVNNTNKQDSEDIHQKDIIYYRARVDDKYWYNITHDDILDIGDNPIPKRSSYFFVKSFA